MVALPATNCPVLVWIVTLCWRGDWLVKWIVTRPALALSELVLKCNCPLGSAASDRVVGAPARPGDPTEPVPEAAPFGVPGPCPALPDALPPPAARLLPGCDDVATAVDTAASMRAMLTPITARARPGVPGKSCRRSPRTPSVMAQAANTLPTM